MNILKQLFRKKIINKYIRRFPSDCSQCKNFIDYGMSQSFEGYMCKVDKRKVDSWNLDLYCKIQGNPKGSLCPRYKVKIK